MGTKRKPNEENKFKNPLKSPVIRGHSTSPYFRANLREKRNILLEDADFYPSSDPFENSKDSEDRPKYSVLKNSDPSLSPKKKKDGLASVKIKCRKEPLPMKFRAFPQSFWQQPNKTPSVSPGTVYCVPPPLSKEDAEENRETLEEMHPRNRQEIVSKPNIDLLFSLFRHVEEQQQKALGQRNAPLIRRGRPKKPRTESKVIRDDDPYLTSSAAESLLPLLPVRTKVDSLHCKIARDEQILAMVSIDGSSSTMLTSTTGQNYSQILSELVVQL